MFFFLLTLKITIIPYVLRKSIVFSLKLLTRTIVNFLGLKGIHDPAISFIDSIYSENHYIGIHVILIMIFFSWLIYGILRRYLPHTIPFSIFSKFVGIVVYLGLWSCYFFYYQTPSWELMQGLKQAKEEGATENNLDIFLSIKEVNELNSILQKVGLFHHYKMLSYLPNFCRWILNDPYYGFLFAHLES